MTENVDTTTKKQLGGITGKGFMPGVSGNPEGRPAGSKNFSTIFEEAVKLIVREQKIPVKNPEVELVVKGLTQALKGNYSFWKDIMDRTYGSPNRSDTNVNLAIQNNIVITDEILEQEAIEILTSRGYQITKEDR